MSPFSFLLIGRSFIRRRARRHFEAAPLPRCVWVDARVPGAVAWWVVPTLLVALGGAAVEGCVTASCGIHPGAFPWFCTMPFTAKEKKEKRERKEEIWDSLLQEQVRPESRAVTLLMSVGKEWLKLFARLTELVRGVVMASSSTELNSNDDGR